MKKLLMCLFGLGFSASAVFAGVEYSGKEMKQVAPPPCPEWYADREFNVGLWGTYIFTGTNWANDTYLHSDHVWGGGLDLKYFFMRYVGIGIEGWAGSAHQELGNVFVDYSDGISQAERLRGCIHAHICNRRRSRNCRLQSRVFGSACAVGLRESTTPEGKSRNDCPCHRHTTS